MLKRFTLGWEALSVHLVVLEWSLLATEELQRRIGVATHQEKWNKFQPWRSATNSWNKRGLLPLFCRCLSAVWWPWFPSRCPHSTFLPQPASHAASADTVSAVWEMRKRHILPAFQHHLLPSLTLNKKTQHFKKVETLQMTTHSVPFKTVMLYTMRCMWGDG